MKCPWSPREGDVLGRHTVRDRGRQTQHTQRYSQGSGRDASVCCHYSSNLLAHPLCSCFADVLFCYFQWFQSDQLSQHLPHRSPHEICRIGRTLAVDERSEVIFSICQGMLPWQPILCTKSTSSTHLVVRVTLARAAPPAYDKGNCYAGRRQTNYLTRWTQANQLSNKLTLVDHSCEVRGN